MCGRFSLAVDVEDLLELFPLDVSELAYRRRYNVAPTDPVLTCGAGGPGHAGYLRWGLIPWWSKPGGKKLPSAINARAETLATNGMFKEPFAQRRCLVLADGFYEWAVHSDKTKTPYRIGLSDWRPFAFAGLWDEWHGPEGPVRSCTIVTTTPNTLMEPIHDRMPVILPPDAYATWLDRELHDTDALQELLVPYPADDMAVYEVGPAVGSVKNDTPDVLAPPSQSRLLL